MVVVFVVEVAQVSHSIFYGHFYVVGHSATCMLQNVNEENILQLLDPLFDKYSHERDEGEYFGDFLMRSELLQGATSDRSLNLHL